MKQKPSGHIGVLSHPYSHIFLKKRKRFIFERLGYKPHKLQELIHFETDAQFIVVVAGRRFGKSVFASSEETVTLEVPNNRVWNIAPTYELSKKAFRIVEQNMLYNLGYIPVVNRKSDYLIRWDWGVEGISELQAKTTKSPISQIGEGIDLAVFDEASKIPPNIWEQAILPSLQDRGGRAIFISTPNGYNWFYDLYMKGQDPNNKDWFSIHAPSWENPYVFPGGKDDPKIEQMKNEMDTILFRQEVCAEFVVMTGRVYSEWDRKLHVRSEAEYDPRKPVIIALDFGYRHPAILACQIDKRNRSMTIFDEYCPSDTTIDECIGWLSGQTWSRNISHIDCDPSGDSADSEGLTGVRRIRRAGFRVLYPTLSIDREIMGGIHRCRLLLYCDQNGEPRLKVFPKCENFIRSIENYRFSESDTNNMPVKDGINDHAMDAWRYLVVSEFKADLKVPFLNIIAKGKNN